MKGNALSITYRKISDLKPSPNDARVHPRAQRRKAKALLRHLGQVAPIIVGPDGTIIDGHLIAEALKELGHEEVATVEVTGRNSAEVRALRLALNRLPQEAGWDRGKLRQEFYELLEIGFDLSLSAFDAVEIDMAFSVDEPSSAAVEEAPPEPDPDAPVISRPGDLWLCGTDKEEDIHRVICGDARMSDTLAQLCGLLRPQMMNTDPPYNLGIPGNVSGLGAVRHRELRWHQAR